MRARLSTTHRCRPVSASWPPWAPLARQTSSPSEHRPAILGFPLFDVDFGVVGEGLFKSGLHSIRALQKARVSVRLTLVRTCPTDKTRAVLICGVVSFARDLSDP